MSILTKQAPEIHVYNPEITNWDDYVLEANKKSWYLNPDEIHPFIGMSIESAGAPRNSNLGRTALAGNMSPNFGDPALSKEIKREIADNNVANLIKELNIPPNKLKIMRPQADYRETKDPLKIINVDEVDFDTNSMIGTSLQERSDFAYTRDMSTVLAIKPGDCPIITAFGQTKEGPIFCMTHIPWPGADSNGSDNGGYVDQMIAYYNQLGIDLNSLRLHVSCGARAESYHYGFDKNPLESNPNKELLFKDIKQGDDDRFYCNIDTPVYIRQQLLKNGISEYQIFQDTTDTASDISGFSSHSRASKNKGIGEINTRDILIASPTNYPNL